MDSSLDVVGGFNGRDGGAEAAEPFAPQGRVGRTNHLLVGQVVDLGAGVI